MYVRIARFVAVALGLATLLGSVDAQAQRRMDEAAYNAAVTGLSATEPDARIAAVEAMQATTSWWHHRCR